MLIRISGIRLGLDDPESELSVRAAKKIGVFPSCIRNIRIFRKSLDARRGNIHFTFTVDVEIDEDSRPRLGPDVFVIEKEEAFKIPEAPREGARPVVVGFGPAGIFCALVLARAGLEPLVLERGRKVEDRSRDVSRFLESGNLDPNSNIQFGEGGAGTFSDGKLNTMVRGKDSLGRFILEEFVRHGAPEEILWQNKPHVGTDVLQTVVRAFREEIVSLGGEVYFETTFKAPLLEKGRVTGIRIQDEDGERKLPCDALFLALGHSARDTFSTLREIGVPMEKKVFSVGVRIEQLQRKIDETQYGGLAGHPALPPSDYKLALPTRTGKTLYTFCMCPGGEVVAAASEVGGVVTNGMSRFARDGENANAALLISFEPGELPADLFAGFDFQRKLEEAAFLAGGGDYRAPAQTAADFLKGQKTRSFGAVRPSYGRGVTPADLTLILPPVVNETLRDGLVLMDRKLPGFAAPDAVLTGPESRSTCPVRILRRENRQSEIGGLYPVGEGAGYAGGITSSAMDGVKSALTYIEALRGGIK